jgi:hypothetical protein
MVKNILGVLLMKYKYVRSIPLPLPPHKHTYKKDKK